MQDNFFSFSPQVTTEKYIEDLFHGFAYIFIVLSAFNNLPRSSHEDAYFMMSLTMNFQAKKSILQNSFLQGLNDLFKVHFLALIWGLNFPQVLSGCSKHSNSKGLLKT